MNGPRVAQTTSVTLDHEVGSTHCGFEDQVGRVAEAIFAGTSGLVLPPSTRVG
jgi:hypothetical protein